MGSWVFIFSQFTEEALVLEALTICLLTAGYAVFWTFRKRRLGSAKEAVPSNLVRAHLNQLIQEAQVIRTQLFGLLAENGIASHTTGPSLLGAATGIATASAGVAAPGPAASSTASAAGDPELGTKLKDLEGKLTQQSEAALTLQGEKAKLEAELAELKAKGPSAPGASAGATGGADNSVQVQSLEKKVKDLEEKLAEYNIIEDDLANLKKLQQENAQLKAALEKGAGGVAPAAPAQAAPTTTVAAAEPAPATPAFEAVVDQVEKSMEPAPTTPAPTAAAAPTDPAAAPTEKAAKNDEDLLAEFEKMLNL